MTIVIAGGSGFVGRAVITECAGRGDRVTVLARRPGEVALGLPDGVRVEAWDGVTVGPWAEALEEADAFINLAGAPIAGKRWSVQRKEALVRSRIESTRAAVGGISTCARPPRVFINASAVGYYGSVPEGDVTEEHEPGAGFLPETCVRWENEARGVEKVGVRVVRARIGVVLARGGALKSMMTPFSMFLGGHPGSGKQWFPWIHLGDLASAFRYIVAKDALHGPVNLTAPAPVRMAEFCATLGRVMGRPSWAPAPGFMLKLAMGEMAGMILTGQRVIPARLQAVGFTFAFPDHEAALRHILSSNPG